MRRSWWVLVVSVLVPGAAGAQDFDDAFERADGPLDGDGWTVFDGSWNIVDGALVAGPASGSEQHAFVGSPPLALPAGDYRFAVDLAFVTADSQPVGRHAGLAFCFDRPVARSTSSGYLVWWIDRNEDRGVNLTRRDAGRFTKLVSGPADPLAEPPSNLAVEITGPTIRVFADDVLVIEFDDQTYRGGHFGLWTWSGDAQEVVFDNVVLEADIAPVVACFTATPERPLPGSDVFFDGTCSVATEGAIIAYRWTFGDGTTDEGDVVEHIFEFADNYVVTLEVEDDRGNVASVDRTIAVPDTLLPFVDDFERPAGPVDGWTVSSGDWRIDDGRLRVVTAGFEEAFIWAGDPAGLIAGDVTIDFDVETLATPLDGVGRHFGVFYAAAQPASRWQTASYDVWWIDRASDFGLEVHRWNGLGGFDRLGTATGASAPELRDPPRHWTVVLEASRIRVFGDGVLLSDVDDAVLEREGHFGLWAYQNGQDVVFDDVRVRSGVFLPSIDRVVACARASRPVALVAATVTFDASCTQVPDDVTVSAWQWSFGDGRGAEGEIVEHAYEFAGEYVVELVVEHDGGDPARFELAVTVRAGLVLPHREEFEFPAGPDVPGWTVSSGAWSISDDGRLEGVTSGEEAHIWLGDPPLLVTGDVTIEFEVEFLAHDPPLDAVGRHAGAFFFAEEPTLRWNTNAYDVWWIDRFDDLGMGLHRWSPLAFLSPGSFELFEEPPARWRIEVDGETIRVYGDDVLVTEVTDNTRRAGYFGFWAYLNGQQVRFDNLCIVEGPFAGSPECDGPPDETEFVRGDVDGNGRVELTDGVFVFNFLFLGGPPPACRAAADTSRQGDVNLTSGVYVLNFLFLGGPAPPPPFPACDSSTAASDEALGCETSPCP